jgi:hypothetical protein
MRDENIGGKKGKNKATQSEANIEGRKKKSGIK